ncbi:hypothetical protein EHW97_14805 [Aeromicrobium camelliae]|uniref:DUF3800 domain-containing protein n=1 Tax=Aeromicrobium camelliae TaxID=1538144 RepID=A0A3N6WAD7_9ACTN|nr:hypothetical protein [Aeromicrobium camelliae]RQN02022.1 hypothetical protein EHW97_14805 [Aeromicrobium camelliae]
MNEFRLHAWVDESMHAPQAGQSGMYLLASAIADPDGCEPVRERLVKLLPKGKTRLHWRDEDEKLRASISAAVGDCDLSHLVVVGAEYRPDSQERARRRCMDRLLFELENFGVSGVVFESRTQSLNKKDLEMVAALRGQGRLKSLRVDFGLPSEEPMLWVPDAVAGAVGLDLRNMDSRPRQLIGQIDLVHIDV